MVFSFTNYCRLFEISVQVAFTARMNSDALNLQSGSAIPYDVEVVDASNAYDNTNHKFTAPSAGLYFFTWSVTSLPGYPVDTALVKMKAYNNNEIIGKLSCHNFSKSNKRNTCAQSTLAQLNAGEKIWVKATERMSLVSGTYWPTFSGIKL